MKKKLLSFLLTICMVLSLLPTAALAMGIATTVTVAGQTLNSTNPYLVNGTAANTGTLGTGGCTAHFDANTGTLTLQDATITSATEDAIHTDQADLIVVLNGINTVSSEKAKGGAFVTISGGNLTFKGTGSLTATGDYAIYAFDDLIVESGTIVANGTTAGLSTNSGKITISGGTVTGTATDAAGYGIGKDWGGTLGLEITGGVVTAKNTGIGGKAIGAAETNTTHDIYAAEDAAGTGEALANITDLTNFAKPYVRFELGKTISGKVTKDGSAPVEGASVQIKKGAAPFGAPATTKADGTYTTQTLPQDTYTAEVTK
ncbi:MAG: carboxypeptidase regulatory-like domain-containing protein, partial [Oscillospiraceae bacterium]